MPSIVVASTNPVKVQATQRGFGQMLSGDDWRVQGVSIESGVSDQPIGHAETLRGARHRALGALDAHPTADYTVGIEGGVAPDFEDEYHLQVFAWVVIEIGRAHV